MNSLYLDCGTGISGDMLVAALLDLGADEAVLRKGLSGISDGGFKIEIKRVSKSGIECCDFHVVLDQEHENHDHDMDYLYGHEHRHETEEKPHVHGELGEGHHHETGKQQHAHGEAGEEFHHEAVEQLHAHGEAGKDRYHEIGKQQHAHGEVGEGHYHEAVEQLHTHGEVEEGHHHETGKQLHAHGEAGEEYHHEIGKQLHTHGEVGEDHHHKTGKPVHSHGIEEGEHKHRNLSEIEKIINGLEITAEAKKLAQKTFRIIAEAEAKAHGKSIEEVHFHEVGALDSIVDIVAASICFDNLGITNVLIPRIVEGRGSVRCQHGILPVPVPAVMNIAEKYHLPLSLTQRSGELITPTGAAFAAAVMSSTELPEVIVPKKVGMGAGKRAYRQPSILRAVLLEEGEKDQDAIWKLECNIDDSTGEQLGYVMERLMSEGARDVFYTPVYMKKNRPAWLLSVIADEDSIERLENIVFHDTTTIGIRKQKMKRRILPRRSAWVETEHGKILVKICEHDGEERVYPEYESVVEIARKSGRPFLDIYMSAVFHAR